MVHVSEELQLSVATLGSDLVLKRSREFLDRHRPVLLHVLGRAARERRGVRGGGVIGRRGGVGWR